MLIDTNIIIEIALKQDRHRECEELLEAIKRDAVPEEIYMSRFALNAVQAILGKKSNELVKELLVMIYQEKIRIVEMEIKDDLMTNSIKNEIGLDFDDTIQFITANKKSTYIVSFDKDFHEKGVEIKTPEEVMQNYFQN